MFKSQLLESSVHTAFTQCGCCQFSSRLSQSNFALLHMVGQLIWWSKMDGWPKTVTKSTPICCTLTDTSLMRLIMHTYTHHHTYIMLGRFPDGGSVVRVISQLSTTVMGLTWVNPCVILFHHCSHFINPTSQNLVEVLFHQNYFKNTQNTVLFSFQYPLSFIITDIITDNISNVSSNIWVCE